MEIKAKAALATLIRQELNRQYLTDEEACVLLQIDGDALADIIDGNIGRFCTFALMRMLNYLDMDVNVTIYPKQKGEEAKVYVYHFGVPDDGSVNFLADGGRVLIAAIGLE